MGSNPTSAKMTDKYLKVLIDYYLNEKKINHLDVSGFVRESGVERVEVVKYLRQNNWKEQTIGVFKQ